MIEQNEQKISIVNFFQFIPLKLTYVTNLQMFQVNEVVPKYLRMEITIKSFV